MPRQGQGSPGYNTSHDTNFPIGQFAQSARLSRGYPAHPRLVNVRVAFRKKFEKVRECPLLSSMESHNRRMELPQCCCVATVVLKVLERHSQDFHG